MLPDLRNIQALYWSDDQSELTEVGELHFDGQKIWPTVFDPDAFMALLFANDEDGVYFLSWPEYSFSGSLGAEPALIGAGVSRLESVIPEGLDAGQGTSSARPVLARGPTTVRRNLFNFSNQFKNSYWNKSSALDLSYDADIDATTVTVGGPSAGPTTRRISRESNVFSNTGPRLYYKDLSAGTHSRVQMIMWSNSPYTTNSNAAAAIFELSNGTIIDERGSGSGGGAFIHDLGNGKYRCGIWNPNDVTDWRARRTRLDVVSPTASLAGNSGQLDYLWEGGESIIIHAAQAEAAIEPTPLQIIISENEFYEDDTSPSFFYLRNTGGSRSITVDLPDLGENATVAYSTESGVQILEGQTVSAGAFNIMHPTDKRLYSFIALDRPLTEAETTLLQTALQPRIASPAEPSDQSVFLWDDGEPVTFDAATGDLTYPDPTSINVVVIDEPQPVPSQFRQTVQNTWLDFRGGEWGVDIVPSSTPSQTAWQYPVFINDGSNYVIVQGGQINGVVDLEEDWSVLYGGPGQNSAAVHPRSSNNILIKDWIIERSWDAIRSAAGVQNQIDNVWVHICRDDAIENQSCTEGEVRNSLFDYVFVGIGLTNFDSSSSPAAQARQNRRFTFRNVLMRMQTYLRNGNIEHHSPFKMSGDSCQIRLIDSVFAVMDPDHASQGRQATAWTKLRREESHGNYWLNLSDTPFGSGYPLPPSECFTVLQGQEARDFWNSKKSAWLAERGFTEKPFPPN